MPIFRFSIPILITHNTQRITTRGTEFSVPRNNKKMDFIKENTVAASGQLVNSDSLRFYGNENGGIKILIVGNSITRHGYLPSIGWYHDFGMAASAEEKDYVHLLMKKWKKRNVDFLLAVKQAASWEVKVNEHTADEENFEDLSAFAPDYIIFRLAENISCEIDGEYFAEQLRLLVKKLDKKGGKVVYTTSFWKNDRVSEAIRAEAEKENLVELEDLGERADMKAYGRFEHAGICAHPGDAGMAAIAERIDNVLRRYF